MPKTKKTSSNGHASPAPGGCKLSTSIRRVQKGTDNVNIGNRKKTAKRLQTCSMADVMERIGGIRYLVRGWIPFGMLTMLLAPPGAGKSAFALYALARVIVTGKLSWFSGARGPRNAGYILWCDTEGTAAITIQRIKDWGIPAERIKVPFADDPLRPIVLTNPKHLARIKSIIEEYKIKLVVVDSLRGAHGGDENSSKVAEVLQNLASIAEDTGAAIIIIHHTRKIGMDEEFSADSSRGSNAIVAMVRSQLGIDRPDRNSRWCRLQMLKENLGLRPQPIGFRIGSDGIDFGDAPEKPRKQTERDRAEQFLLDTMKPGKWSTAGDIIDAAKADGLSGNALQRAREALEIVKPDNVRKIKKVWQWRLPCQETKPTPR